MKTTRRAVLTGGSLLTSVAFLRDISIVTAQPVDDALLLGEVKSITTSRVPPLTPVPP